MTDTWPFRSRQHKPQRLPRVRWRATEDTSKVLGSCPEVAFTDKFSLSAAELAAFISMAMARAAFTSLKDDEDDLYFEKGQATNGFMNDLVGNRDGCFGRTRFSV